jgi:muconolactone delta-isomerase
MAAASRRENRPSIVAGLTKCPLNIRPDHATVERLQAEEKAMSQRLQREGSWWHLWRIVGQYANVSIFDVGSPEELHDILSRLPLFPYMEITVRALCRHPSSIEQPRA